MPYGTTRNKWDAVLPLDELWREYHRVTKPNAAVALFSQQPFTTDLINSNRREFRYEVIWQKTMATGFLNANRMPLKAHENILIFYRKLPTYNPQFTFDKPYHKTKSYKQSNNYGAYYDVASISADGRRYPTDVVKIKNGDQGGLHPTRKPVDVCAWFIKTYTNAGDTVLDNCMGSGSTGEAALLNRRNFVGIELDETYFNTAKQRLAAIEK